MRALLLILGMMSAVSVALADKPTQPAENPIQRVGCPFDDITYYWQFIHHHGFTTSSCDDGGLPVWEFGAGPIGGWWTVIGDDYPNDAGESLISPSFFVDSSTYLVQISHTYFIENSYDGGNVSVNGVVVEPVEGYPDDEISDSIDYYAWCVDGEPGFTGVGSVTSCFDLSAFMGEEVRLSLNFGSDSSGTDHGWVINGIMVGGTAVATDGTTWSAVKGLYR